MSISRWAARAAALGIMALSGHAARAQVGSGWVEYDPPSTVQLDGANGIETNPGSSTSLMNGGASYSNAGGIETFTLFDPISNRVERRMRNEYTSGRRQFEGEVRVSPPTNDESVTQIFGGTSGATTQMIRAYAVDNGTLRKVPGSVVLATNIWGRWIRINVIHDVAANNVKTYVDGVLKATGDGEAPATWYHKYGCYGSLRTPSAKVEWRNVKHFRDGSEPPGPPPVDGGARDVMEADLGGAGGSPAVDAGAPDARTGGAGGGGSGGTLGSGGSGGGSGGGGSGSSGGAGGPGGAGGGSPRGTGGKGGSGGAEPEASGGAAGSTEARAGGGCAIAGTGGSPAALLTLLALALLRRRRGP